MWTGIDKSNWTNVGWAQKTSEALERLQKSPHLLSDDDLQRIDAYTGGGEAAMRKRGEAQLVIRAKTEAQARKAPAARARFTQADVDAMRKAFADVVLNPEVTEEEANNRYNAVLNILKKAPAEGNLFFAKLAMDALRSMNSKNAERNLRLCAHDSRLIALETGSTKSEEAVGPRDQGVWDGGTTYRKNDGVTCDGHYWIAQRETRTMPTERNGDWRLAVHRGKQGRDGKPADDAAIDRRLKHHGLIP